MSPTTALDLSIRRYSLARQLSQNPWHYLPAGPRVANSRARRASGRQLLLDLAQSSAASRPLVRRSRRMLRRATRLAHQHRQAIVMGTETVTFGTFLAIFLSCLWLLAA